MGGEVEVHEGGALEIGLFRLRKNQIFLEIRGKLQVPTQMDTQFSKEK
jgi:hypothetical protein